MITTSEAGNILYTECSKFGPECYQTLNLPQGEVSDERIVVIPKPRQEGTYWHKSFCEVNWLVPDLPGATADMARLEEVERAMMQGLHGNGRHDGTPYRFKAIATSVLAAGELKCHFVNARVAFESMNINKN